MGFDKLADGLRNDSSRNLRVSAPDVGPSSLFVEFNLIAAGKQHVVGLAKKFGLHFGENHFLRRKMRLYKLLRGSRKLFESNRLVIVG